MNSFGRVMNLFIQMKIENVFMNSRTTAAEEWATVVWFGCELDKKRMIQRQIKVNGNQLENACHVDAFARVDLTEFFAHLASEKSASELQRCKLAFYWAFPFGDWIRRQRIRRTKRKKKPIETKLEREREREKKPCKSNLSILFIARYPIRSELE